MAKSLRSKTKRSFRRVKRESGVFAVADATRLERLSSKLKSKIGTDNDGDVSLEKLEQDGDERVEEQGWWAFALFESGMEIDSKNTQKVSTSGPRMSRRESWRLSKGMKLQRKNPDKINKLGLVAAKRKGGRSKRRR
ncbi:hypothetical protein M422DRAFT_149883 [Sphaerobolus stellatus SS14]|nr:hypothetical protein M422DRAFT_149883 [Sphaerobolus stellatus SS14]